MKKIAKYFFAALTTMAAMSCVKELNVEKPVELTGKAYEFTATIGDETKTTLDAETMTPMWLGDRSGNEYITVMEPNNLNTYVAEGIYEPTAEVTFVMAENGGAGLTGKSVFAVSPAEAAVDCFNSADSVGVTVAYNNTQYAYPETYDPAGPVAVAYNADVEANPHFSFKNTSALLKFRVMEGSDPVKSVKIYALGGEKIAGTMHLVTKGEDSYIIPADTLATNWVELKGLYEEALDVDTDYYIAVAPALLENGIGIQFNYNEIQTYTISKELNIERNKIYDLGNFYYDNQDDDNWYVIGNFTDGNVNNITKTMFEKAGDNLVAKNVTFVEGQSFKIYNPALGESLYADVNLVESGTWVDLTEGNGYSYPEDEGTFDIYIDYALGNVIELVESEWGGYDSVLKEEHLITGVALMAPGAEAPEYLSVDKSQYTWFDDEAQLTKIIDFGVTEEGTFRMGNNYDEMDNLDVRDPEMEGAWMLIGNVGTEYFVESKHATAGYVTAKLVAYNPAYGEHVLYEKMAYTNLTESTVDLLSTWGRPDLEGPLYDEDGSPVLDKYGDPVWTNASLAICYTDEKYNVYPVTATKTDSDQDIVMPMPDEGLCHIGYAFDETYSIEYKQLFDMGTIKDGYLVIAENYDLTATVPAEYDENWEVITPSYSYLWPNAEVHTNKWFVRSEYKILSYEVNPSNSADGQIMIYAEDKGGVAKYFMINYSGYSYGCSIGLNSSEIYDMDGNPIPVEGVNGAYWEGIGLFGYYDSPEVAEVKLSDIKLIDSYPATPDLAQWAFNWDLFGAPMVLDFGCFEDSQYYGGYDTNVMGPDIPEDWKDKFITYFGPGEYTITPDSDDPASGTINLSVVDPFSGEISTQEGSYAGYNGGMMYLTMEFAGVENAPAVLVNNAKFMPDPYTIGGTN